MFMSKNEFIKWAELTATDFFRKEIDSDYLMYKVSIKKRMIAIFNMKTGNYGVAKCKRTDEFIPTIGFAIAWARYNKKDVPFIGTHVSYNDLKVNDRIVVNNEVCTVVQKTLYNRPTFGGVDHFGIVYYVNKKGEKDAITTCCVDIDFIKPFMRYEE